jgi:hypothetical protein
MQPSQEIDSLLTESHPFIFHREDRMIEDRFTPFEVQPMSGEIELPFPLVPGDHRS